MNKKIIEGTYVSIDSSNQGWVKDKILQVLAIFPFLSHASLHVLIGTAIPPSLRRDALDTLLNDGILTEISLDVKNNNGRNNNYKIYCLSNLISNYEEIIKITLHKE